MSPRSKKPVTAVVCSLFVLGVAYLNWSLLVPHQSEIETLPPRHASNEVRVTQAVATEQQHHHHQPSRRPVSAKPVRYECKPKHSTKLAKWTGVAPNQPTLPNETNTGQGQCCPGVEGDIDHGFSMYHFTSRLMCAGQRYANHRSNKADVPFRVIQIGANTGDNANDHLVKFLKMGIAEAALMEPVPWVYERLTDTYKDHSARITTLNAALSSKAEGNVSFTAPKKDARGWVPQMGGLSLPPRSLASAKKKGLLKFFETIEVRSFTVRSLLQYLGWERLPDIVVIDVEGFDAKVVEMFLQVMHDAKETIPIIQYEWKHLQQPVLVQLRNELASKGYCVVRVHYDDIAIHTDAAAMVEGGDGCSASFTLEVGK